MQGWTRARRGALSGLVIIMAAAVAGPALAQDQPEPPPGSWAGQLDLLTNWLEERRHESRCESRCYALDRLRLTGNVEAGSFEFELQGSLLAEGSVAVPLFGPPDQVRIDQATVGDQPARIGFEDDVYFLFTDERRFTLRGRLTLQGDRALFIAGPLNSLEADVEGGRVVEGERLSGLSSSTIHFERGTDQANEPEEPTVFQLSRAIRVSREVNFEYQLVMRSGNDLGVVRLPLRFGEEVLEVEGSTGWRVDASVLLLPTAGRSAEITITGTLPEVGTFSPDERSSYEWWLFESDAEHRLSVEGEGRQFDSTESPISRSQPSSRLYMVHRGQQMTVEVQRLVSAEVLGAVVRRHQRTVVLTRQGDLVAQDQLSYENNGIDFLLFQPQGRAIFLATDNQAERIMHKQQGDEELMIPLRTGTHSVKVQSLAESSVAPLAGRLEVPLPDYPLTTSRSTLRVGLPTYIHPLLLIGGDEIRWFFGIGDLVAVILGILAALVVLRRRTHRVLGAVVLSGLWFISGGLFVMVMVVLALGGGLWVLSRLMRWRKLGIIAGVVAVLAIGFFSTLGVMVFAVGSSRSMDSEMASSADDWARQAEERPAPTSSSYRGAGDSGPAARRGNRTAQLAAGGVIEGVTPVALPLPGYSRSVSTSRELVTEQRPFQPALYYVTDWAVLPLGAIWVLCLGLLIFGFRSELSNLYRRFRERLAHPPDAPPASPGQPASAPAEAEPEPEAEHEAEADSKPE